MITIFHPSICTDYHYPRITIWTLSQATYHFILLWVLSLNYPTLYHQILFFVQRFQIHRSSQRSGVYYTLIRSYLWEGSLEYRHISNREFSINNLHYVEALWLLFPIKETSYLSLLRCIFCVHGPTN